MIIRHRTPTIFNIYMVDVLCCALGCVILLWQLYHAESEEQTEAARTAVAKLEKLGIDLKTTGNERDQLASERDQLKADLDKKIADLDKKVAQLAAAGLDIKTLSAERDLLKSTLDKTSQDRALLLVEMKGLRGKLDKEAKLAVILQQELETLRETHLATEALLASTKIDRDFLAKKEKLTAAELAAKLKELASVLQLKADAVAQAATLQKRLAVIEKELNLKAVELKFASDKIDLTEKNLQDAEARAKRLEKLHAALQAAGKESLAKLSVSDLRIKLLEQQLERSKNDLASSGKRIDELLSTKDLLMLKLLASSKDLAALKDAADRRFEGITLEGKKVVFLVDISGSMVLKEVKKPDPDKWFTVVQTIERVASSLIEAESFQLVVFSTEAQLGIGKKLEWQKFDRATSPKQIGDALRALKPQGGTNLFVGLEKSFEFRKLGMDALFVFSDGLPTEGPGLAAADAKLTDTEQSEKLGKHIRQQLRTNWNAPLLGRRVRINAVGFFFESPDVGAFLWALARENEGSFVGMSRP